jgi:transcription antitermination factor NusG
VENLLDARNGEALSTSSVNGNVTHETVLGRDSDRGWYVLFTKPCHEKQVSVQLKVREIEHFLPLYSSVSRWKSGQTVVRECPLFPSYLFVQMAPAERVKILNAPGVLSIVGTSKGPTPLSNVEVETLRKGLDVRKARPHPYLTVGERARIRNGSLTGLQGIVLRQKNSTRIVLTLELIMQSVAIEVDIADLESIRPIATTYLS